MKKNKNNEVDIRQLFLDMQDTMCKKLTTFRKNVGHEGTKGDGSENVWVKFLNKYLPKRYSVSRAKIIDHWGKTSDQIDVVIYDSQYTPFIFNEDGVRYIPAESVYAVFEAKQEINKGFIEYAGNKIASVRKLARTSAEIVDRGIRRTPANLFPVLGGFLCLGNGWKKSIKDSKPFTESINALDHTTVLNVGCVLNDLSFMTDLDASDPSQLVIKQIHFSTKEETLIFFFLKLVDALQKLGTVRPMELDKYINNLKSK